MRNRFFDFDKPIEVPVKEEKTGTWGKRYLAVHYQKMENVKRDIKRLPETEEYFFLQTQKQFNAFTFIPLILENLHIRELWVSTYSVSIRVAEALVQLFDTGGIDQMTLLVSDSLVKRNPVTLEKIQALAEVRPNFNIILNWNHSKVTLAKTEKDYFDIEGSGNWSRNAAIEQYMFANSKGLFEFRKEIFEVRS